MRNIKVIILPGGKVEIAVDGDIDFDTAKKLTEMLTARLGTTLGVSPTSDVESHKPGGAPHAHLTENLKAR